MATKKTKAPAPVESDDVTEIENDVEDDVDDAPDDLDELEDLDDDVDVIADDEIDDDIEDDVDDDDDDDEDDEEHDEDTADALEELENQELQLLDDEANEAMLIDEVEELRAMRRAELTMNVDAQLQKADEFVCQNCFMVKRTSQLANKRKMFCRDCVD